MNSAITNVMKTSAVMVGLYLFNILFLPAEIDPSDGNFIFIVTLSHVLLVGMLFLSDKLYHWLISDLVYFACALISYPKGVFGIGVIEDIVVLLIKIAVVQFLVWCFVKISNRLANNKKDSLNYDKKNAAQASMTLIGVYVIQFFLIPLSEEIYYLYYEGLLYILTIMIVTIIGMFVFTYKMRYWLLADIIYILAMMIYNKNGLYGIGKFGMFEAYQYNKNNVPFYLSVFLIIIIIEQLIALFIVKIIKLIYMSKKNTSIGIKK